MAVSQIACAAISPAPAKRPPRSSASRASGTAGALSAPWSIVARIVRTRPAVSARTSGSYHEQRRGDGARCGDRTRQRVAAEMRRAQRGLGDVLRRRQRDVLRERQLLEAL